MDKVTRTLLWTLGVLAAFWTVANVVAAGQTPADCPACPAMTAGLGQIGAMAPGPAGTAGAWTVGTTLVALTTWLVMIVLDATLLSLIVTAIYPGRGGIRSRRRGRLRNTLENTAAPPTTGESDQPVRR